MGQRKPTRLMALAVGTAMLMSMVGGVGSANAAEVTNAGTPTLSQRSLKSKLKGKKFGVDPRITGMSGKVDAFVMVDGTAGVEKKAEVLQQLNMQRSGSPESRQAEANREGKSAARQAEHTSNNVFENLKALDPTAQKTYTTSYSTTGVVVHADAAALRKLAEHCKDVVGIVPMNKMTPSDDAATANDASKPQTKAPANGESTADNPADKPSSDTEQGAQSAKPSQESKDSDAAKNADAAKSKADAQSKTQNDASGQQSEKSGSSEPTGEVPYNKHNDQFINAVNTWNQTGQTGKNVNVAVVDTGLDYTHADFGGAGTTAAYQTALASTKNPLTDPTLKNLLDNSKFKGGYDFAGPTYGSEDANGDMISTPQPDDNPIDGEGGHHGTHVAGTLAGYGINADGSKFSGDYKQLNNADVQGMKIGPGSAPEASLYALKVFGDQGGSTDLVLQALDWVAKHNLNCAPADKISIVSMSLGDSFSQGDAPDALAVNNLYRDGVVSVIAAGNDGDITDVMGSPSSARSALTVGATETGMIVQDKIDVTAGPADLVGKSLAGQYSSSYTGNFSVEAPVVAIKGSDEEPNGDGCDAYSAADAAAVNGKIAYVHWDDSNVSCGSRARFDNAKAAGAVGIIFDSQNNVPAAGIAGNASIPGFQIIKKDSDDIQLDQKIEAGGVSVKLDSTFKLAHEADYSNDISDTIADFSSRGIHGSYDGTFKPDVSAPGVGIGSASAGTGNGEEVMQGTSMATPLVAGVTALVRGAHPDWNATQVKEQMINTSVHDIKTDHSANAKTYGPLRVGAGRVDALAAVNNPVQLSSEDTDLVSAGFGIVQVPKNGYNAKKTITVSNTSNTDRSYTVAYKPRTETPGVNYAVSASSITVPANGTAKFDVTLNIPDQSALRHTLDETQPDNVNQIPSSTVTDATGVVELTPSDNAENASPLRLAVASAPKPVAQTNASYDVTSTGHQYLEVSGHGFDQGSNANQYISNFTPLVLSATDPVDASGIYDPQRHDLPVRDIQGFDIRAIGYSTTAPQMSRPDDGLLSFGIVTDKSWSRLTARFGFTIDLDTDGDGSTDVELITTNALADGTIDNALFEVLNVKDPNNVSVIDAYTVPSTYVSDSNRIVMQVPLDELGVSQDTKSAPMNYKVETWYLGPDNIIDTAGGDASTKFDAVKPSMWFGTHNSGAISFGGDSVFSDEDGTSVPVHVNAQAKTKAAGKSTLPPALIIHDYGEVPDTADQKLTIDYASIADKSKLQGAVNDAAKFKQEDYTAASWLAFQQALASANTVLADTDALQGDVDAAADALTKAEKDLVKQVAGQSDRDALQAAVDAASKLKESDYTVGSWKPFAAALAKAKGLLADPNAAKSDIVAATVALNQARQALKKLESGHAPGVGPAAPSIGSPASGLASGAALPSGSSRRSHALAVTGSSVVFEVLASLTLLAGGVAVSLGKRRRAMRL